ncbi:uncharacterized protein LOC111374357 isoform X3 [Olea europaea var. sylvestris]|uniref:uncharacterized protein LOC111374357 isoform X2 n=1 Tax=Olea europaea var. sylvestris TaxID=158386 RepID=UPI000C1D638B|nr:uncharacterized protein LOC111374357 isoform X2 [Olea europaea var. sylvestris]XP_022852783.1 uncharacterized protein LOC111374357 isoform X3 [Olea europaea var. sylvestris]
MAGQKISSCEANLLPRNEKCPNHDAVSVIGTNGDSAGSMIPRSSVISTSITSAEQTFESASTGYEQVSSKCCEISTQSSDKVTLARPISVKSDISMENGLPLSNENYIMDVGKKQVSHLNAVEDGFNLIMHVKQNKTESSCSDSSSGILPVNHSQQETLKRASSFNNHSGSVSSSNSTGFHHRMEEPVTASSESGMSAQIDHKAFLKGRARNSTKAPLMIKDSMSFHSMKANIPLYGPQNQENRNISRPDEDNPEWGSAVRTPRDGARDVDEETLIYRWVSGCASSDEEKRDVTVGKSLTCSGNSKNFNCSTEMEEHIRSSDANDNHITFGLSTKISGESENMMSMKGESVKMDPKVTDNINDGFLSHKSTAFLMTKPTKVFARDQSKSVIVFDLNEDINTNELDDGEQSVVETVSSHNVIHVVAKAGVPRGRPLIPLKFEGGLGWKGSAATSAFRPAFLLNSFDKNPFSRNLTGIDLNVAAVEDIPEIGFQAEDVWISSASPFQDSCSKVGSRRAKKLNIDLNCLCDDVVESPQFSLPAESKNRCLADLDLNANTSAGYACNNVDWQGQASQPLENKALFSVNSREHDVNFTPTYLPDLSSVNVFNYSHSHSQMMAAPNVLKQFEEMHRVSPLQPKLPYPLHMLPLQNYPSHGPLYIAPMKPFMFNMHYPGTIPSVRDPQLLKPETVPVSLGIPRLVEVAHGQSRVDITSSIHRIDVKSENNSSTSVSKRDKAGELTLTAKNSSVDENDQSVNQEAWCTKLMKRKEPEGGWDCYHVGHRQVT